MQLPGYGTAGLVVRWSGGRPNPVDLDQAEDVTFVEEPAEQFDRWERNNRQAIGTPPANRIGAEQAEASTGGEEDRRKPSSWGSSDPSG